MATRANGGHHLAKKVASRYLKASFINQYVFVFLVNLQLDTNPTVLVLLLADVCSSLLVPVL